MTSMMDNCWLRISDHVLLQIFKHLTAEDIIRASGVCQTWYRVAQDELLWKWLLLRDWKIDPSLGIAPGKHSWQREYIRLWQQAPVLETEVLKGHTNQVLHVSFSHNGKYFATCSKDGYILLWDAGYPARIKHYHDMKSFSWKYTQFSQFNESDTLLLVSGVHFGTHSNTGEIAVFSIQDEFELQCRMFNKPYDFFGTWYNDEYLLSGDLHWLAHLVSCSIIWLNRASQEAESEFTSVMNQMFRFYNRSASSIRAITVANCIPNASSSVSDESSSSKCDEEKSAKGNPVSHREISSSSSAWTQESREIQSQNENWLLWAADPDFQYLRASLQTTRDELLAEESDEEYSDNAEVTESRELGAAGGDSREHSVSAPRSDEFPRAASEESEDSVDVLDLQEKLLIFTMGSSTYTPHQIGLKRVGPFAFCKKIDRGPSLAERIAARARQREEENQGLQRQEPAWQDFDSVADRFDKVDHVIDLHGHIIGMGLSPDHQYLYVNVRPWPPGCFIENPLQPPPIAQEIDIHVIDLVQLKQVGTLLRAHKAYTPNDECFFIFLDVSKDYVASGAEDKHGYLWDRHYGVCLAKFPHADVVNSVAFNPRDPEMMITASDDYTLKIWRSRSKARRLGLQVTECQKGIEMRRKR